MKKRRTYDLNGLMEAIKISTSFHEVLRRLDLPLRTFYYNQIYKDIFLNNINVTHFVKSKGRGKKAKLEDVLVDNSTYPSTNVKRKLLAEDILKNECSECLITDWRGKELVLQLDHINGKSNDNRIENLRLLCPNCHSQTDTYGGKNLEQIKIDRNRILTKQCECGKYITDKATKCQSCAKLNLVMVTKANYPPLPELLGMVNATSYVAVARKLGVSDNAIRHYIKRRIKRI